MNLVTLSKLLKESGMRKVGSGLYMFTLLSYLLYLTALPPEDYKAITIIIVISLMGANAYEHHKKSGGKSDAAETEASK